VTAPAARRRRVIGTLLWSAQIQLAAFFLFNAAPPKLIGSDSAVQEFGLIGAGQWLRFLVGMAELAGAITLLTRWLAGLVAAGLAADLAGATIINATVLHDTTYGVNVWMTALLCAVFVLLAQRRRHQIKGLAAAARRQPDARAAVSTMRTQDRTILRYLDRTANDRTPPAAADDRPTSGAGGPSSRIAPAHSRLS
jgi:hypothetical protein